MEYEKYQNILKKKIEGEGIVFLRKGLYYKLNKLGSITYEVISEVLDNHDPLLMSEISIIFSKPLQVDPYYEHSVLKNYLENSEYLLKERFGVHIVSIENILKEQYNKYDKIIDVTPNKLKGSKIKVVGTNRKSKFLFKSKDKLLDKK